MEKTIFGYPSEFLETLTTDEMNKVLTAKHILQEMEEKLDMWAQKNGGYNPQTTAYINEIAARQEQQRKDAEALRASFK